MLFLIAVDALPENLSAAESLARNVAGFAASLLSLMSFCRAQRSCLAEVRALRSRFHTGSALPHAGSRTGCAAWWTTCYPGVGAGHEWSVLCLDTSSSTGR